MKNLLQTARRVPFTRILMFIFLIFSPLLLQIISADWAWWQAWLLLLFYAGSAVASRVIISQKHPDLLAERGSYKEVEGVMKWDRLLVEAIAMYLPTLMLIIAALDHRFKWSTPVAISFQLLSMVVIMGGYAFSVWAMVENRFFSAVVRIQKDRGHTVVTTGPYRFVRHPGYAGALLGMLVMPLFLTSWWTYLACAPLAVLYVVRTALEDRTLQQELPGYREYAQKTRFRLFPGIW